MSRMSSVETVKSLYCSESSLKTTNSVVEQKQLQLLGRELLSE